MSNRGLSEALRALKLRPGSPTDDDRPPQTVIPGRKVELVPGQLDLDEVEHGTAPDEQPPRAA
jgi:hypothetical protein